MSSPPDNRIRNEQLLTREDSLEYFIKFPSPQNVISTWYDYAEYNFNNKVNAPIVLLFGWAGCQDRYLMKYSKIYEDRG